MRIVPPNSHYLTYTSHFKKVWENVLGSEKVKKQSESGIGCWRSRDLFVVAIKFNSEMQAMSCVRILQVATPTMFQFSIFDLSKMIPGVIPSIPTCPISHKTYRHTSAATCSESKFKILPIKNYHSRQTTPVENNYPNEKSNWGMSPVVLLKFPGRETSATFCSSN